MATSNVETMHEIYNAFAKGDVPTVLAALSPDIVWTEFDAPGSPMGGVHNGPNEVIQGVFMTLMGHFDEVGVIPDEILPAGEDKVLVLGQFKGKNKSTGKSFDTRFAHVATFSGGKISKMDVYEDTGTVVSTMS